jgi:hypothetical protein
MKKLSKASKNMIGGGLAVVVGLALLKRKLGESVASTQVAAVNSQIEAQQAINDAVVTATAPPPSVAGLDGLGYEARQSIMRSGAYRNALAGAQQRQKRARAVLAGLGVTPAVARAAVPPSAPHHPPGSVFRQDQHVPWKRKSFDSPLNYANLDGTSYQPSMPGGQPSGSLPGMGHDISYEPAYFDGIQPSGSLPGMGLIGRLGDAVANMLPGGSPNVPSTDEAISSMNSTINASIGLVSGAVLIGLAYWGLKK